MSLLKDWAEARNMPPELEDEIRLHHEITFEHLQGVPEAELMASLPLCLRKKIARHIGHNLLAKADVFRALPTAFIETISTCLTTGVVEKGLDIIAMGDVANEMYFIARGKVEVIINEGGKELVVATLDEGACFGESALLTHALRSATIRAATTCELFVLARSDFDHLLSFSKELTDNMKKIAILRLSVDTRRRFKILLESLNGIPWFQAQQHIRLWREHTTISMEEAQYANIFNASASALTDLPIGRTDTTTLSPEERIKRKASIIDKDSWKVIDHQLGHVKAMFEMDGPARPTNGSLRLPTLGIGASDSSYHGESEEALIEEALIDMAVDIRQPEGSHAPT